MFRKLLKGALVTAAIVMAGGAWAKLPPPPVNQNLGIPDGRFADMTYQTCLGCHGDPKNAPAPVKIGYLPDRHHLRVDTPIDPDYSASPFPDRSPDGTHKCATCHEIDVIEDPNRPGGQYFKFALEPTDPQFRDCLNCHKQKKDADGNLTATVHHLTDKAQKKLCYQCHGSLVNNATDDHRVPDQGTAPDPDKARHCGEVMSDGDRNFYDISLITPWPGDNYDEGNWVSMLQAIYADCPDFAKRYYDPNELGGQFVIDPPRYRYEMDAAGNIQAILVPDGEQGGRRTGNCEHCHFAGENPGDAVQPGTGLAKSDIGTNMSNHHSTGVGQPGSGSVHGCDLCHAPENPPNFTIRGCEVCHAISTVHAIEYDADGDGIVPFGEKPFMGHIGNDLNCRGCHLNYRTGQVYQASASYLNGSVELGGVPPSVSDISALGSVAGEALEISITGSSFNGPNTRLELVGTDGQVHEIPMKEYDYTSAKAVIPADLPADNYELYVVRGRGEFAKRSPAMSFVVAPGIDIEDVSCNGGKVTITGSGFGDTFVGGGGLGVASDEGSCSIESWSDTRIVANCGSGTGSVTVDGLFGEASSSAACGGTDSSGRPKWWSIWSWWSSWSWARR